MGGGGEAGEMGDAHRPELLFFNLLKSTGYYMGRDSAVGIATRYGLDSPGIESRWRRDFPHPSRLALGPPVQWVPGLSWG